MRMQLLDSRSSLIHAPIDCRCNRQRSPDDGANPGQEARKRLRPFLFVDNLHRRYIVAEEYSWNAAPLSRQSHDPKARSEIGHT